MNFYDKEINIIEKVQLIPLDDILKVYSSEELDEYFYTLYNENEFKNWIDNSGEINLPPDFFNEKKQFMLEVMRVDDYENGSNSVNALETKLYNKLFGDLNINKVSFENSLVKSIIIPNLKNASDYNYGIYVKNFSRIVKKHAKKISNYRKNHPNYQLGFLIFDESTGYIKPYDLNLYENLQPGNQLKCKLHYHWLDRNLIDTFIDEDIEYIIWVTPNKNIPGNSFWIPNITLIDVKKYKEKFYNDTILYSQETLRSIEIPM